jgi:hypothetical protein
MPDEYPSSFGGLPGSCTVPISRCDQDYTDAQASTSQTRHEQYSMNRRLRGKSFLCCFGRNMSSMFTNQSCVHEYHKVAEGKLYPSPEGHRVALHPCMAQVQLGDEAIVLCCSQPHRISGSPALLRLACIEPHVAWYQPTTLHTEAYIAKC